MVLYFRAEIGIIPRESPLGVRGMYIGPRDGHLRASC